MQPDEQVQAEQVRRQAARDWRGERVVPLPVVQVPPEDDHQGKRQRPGEGEVPVQVGVPVADEVRVGGADGRGEGQQPVEDDGGWGTLASRVRQQRQQQE